nr:dTDP-4-dehydrorhamnose 3,5-epimerase [Kibdelosporangium sp. MJ126-NF4]CEL17281.1 dTDP-4-dehydrorhamnose 3,5-epimerase [Kibdelosporangium sp. MJ126-NF4]CTQ91489.1 dTDP-4-dehydrorhamnose 3,5-epimerase (EC 5.1.3.13) [Kibdelosporangium sp. MJ126-NF4]
MRTSGLAVTGAVVFEPEVFPDERGLFVSPMQQHAFADVAGLPVFPVAQASFSRSRRHVGRGIHFTRTPPGCAKFVYCPYGRALDFVVDLRVGSPTFGLWDSVILDGSEPRGVYLPIGVGHAFVALQDDTIMSYLLSTAYRPELECAILLTDSEIGLPVPPEIVLSQRDRDAPTLAEAAALLPDHADVHVL